MGKKEPDCIGEDSVYICMWSMCGLCGRCDWELEVSCTGLIHADLLLTCLDIPDPARSTSK